MQWRLLSGAMVAVALTCGAVWGESASTLLEQGVYYQETAGNLDAAIQAYQKILDDAQANRKYVAEAQYRLGICLQKKGQTTGAIASFRKVVTQYSDQEELAAQAREKLEGLGGSATAATGTAAMPARPGVIQTNPPALAEDVDPSLDKITVTFNYPMMDRSWSWTGGGETYPKTTGKPYYDTSRRVCTLPVKLEPGKVYWVGVNSKDFRNFRTTAGASVPWYAIVFATRSADGKPTSIPKDMLERARAINAIATAQVSTAPKAQPKVVRTVPKAFANDVSPSLGQIMAAFDQKMMDKSWSWTGGGETFPKSAGDVSYDGSRRTCAMPVKLEPGKVYWVGINSPDYQNFRAVDGTPAERYVILFATLSAGGKPTPIPEDLFAQAREINGSNEASSGSAAGSGNDEAQKRPIGKAVSSFPEPADLSSPETACAAWNRAYARLDAKAITAANWYETDPAEIEATRSKADSQDWKMYSQALQSAVVVEVWTYKDDLAGVITFLQFPPGQGRHPFSLRYFGRMNYQWKNYGEDRLASLREARETFRTKQQRIAENFAIFRNGKSAASQPGSLQGITVRKVDKVVTEFPEKVDLSTPESASAAYLRASARADAKAIADLSWMSKGPEGLKDIEQWYKRLQVEDPEKIYVTALANARIVQVLTYRDDLADVIVYLPFPAGKGRAPYSSRGFGQVNGQWKNIGEDRYNTLEEAIGQFHHKKDNLYAHFLKVSGKAPAADDLSAQPIDLSTPAGTVRGFVQAAAAGNVDRALSYVLPGGIDYDDISEILTGTSPSRSKQQATQMFKSLDVKDAVEVVKVAQNGQKADVVFRVKFAKEWSIQEAGKSVTYKPGEAFEMDATLKQVGTGWLIDGI